MTEQQTENQPSTRRGQRSNNTIWWVLGILAVAIVVPTVACGALGAGFALAFEGGGSGVQNFATRPSVALIEVQGPIFAGESSGVNQIAGSDTIISLIEEANEDANIKAIVLRVDSPGGGVVASDEIHHALTQVDKPIVVSMGTTAASGGYYISAPADYIYANPHTLTGSIGVISQFVTAEDLLSEVGVDVVIITAGESKDFGSFSRDMTEEEQAYWEDLLEETHNGFIRVVADGRGMPVEQVRQLADGRVYTGQQAVDLGLVDEVGYLDDAISKAGDLSGLGADPHVVPFEPASTFIDELYGLRASSPLSLDALLDELAPPSLEFKYLGP